MQDDDFGELTLSQLATVCGALLDALEARNPTDAAFSATTRQAFRDVLRSVPRGDALEDSLRRVARRWTHTLGEMVLAEEQLLALRGRTRPSRPIVMRWSTPCGGIRYAVIYGDYFLLFRQPSYNHVVGEAYAEFFGFVGGNDAELGPEAPAVRPALRQRIASMLEPLIEQTGTGNGADPLRFRSEVDVRKGIRSFPSIAEMMAEGRKIATAKKLKFGCERGEYEGTKAPREARPRRQRGAT